MTTNDNQPRAMMTIEQILALVPVSRSTLANMERTDNFPKGFYVSGNRKCWFADEVIAWQNALPGNRSGYVRPRSRPKLVRGTQDNPGK
jgi:predicted DNA-binding transcriptional regulator AlpA